MIIGKKIVRLKTIDSTNAEARRLIKRGEGEGLVILADELTRGRGKPGSRWISPPGNLYFSAVVRPLRNPQNLSPVTISAALAARTAAIKISGLPVLIKWPNDLLIHAKKVGGILTERVSSGHLIIGIGINVAAAPEGINAGALNIEAGRKISLERLTETLIHELDKAYLEYLKKV
jgi:BirA family biotin operon repressor/biotin-[acetyl-CoA-carboxylase] ligase